MFEELQDLDDGLCEHGQRLVKHIITNRKGNLRKHAEALENHIIAGSLTEHATIARIFQENVNFVDHLNRETELDVNYVLFEIPEKRKADVIHDVPNKKGYVNVQVDLDLMKNARNLGWDVSDDYIMDIITKTTTQDGRRLLQPYKFKKETLNRLARKNTDNSVELIIAAALNKPIKDVEIVALTEEITGASVALEFLIKLDHNPLLKVSMDTATLIRLPWWPSVGNEWKQRKRRWPSQEKIDEISRIGFIIAKPSDTTDMDTTELRYSFGHVERELVRMRSRYQNLVYLIFKAMFYKWITPINNEKISSYIAKTIMLWTCEDFPPTDTMWSKNFASLIDALSCLFVKLRNALEKGYLESYFIKEIDIFKRIPSEDIRKALEKVNEIFTDVKAHLPTTIDKELQAGREILQMIRETADVFEELQRKDFSRLLRQPQLLQEESLLSYISEDILEELKRKVLEKIHGEAGRIVRQVSNDAGEETQRIVRQVSDEAARFEKRLRKFFR